MIDFGYTLRQAREQKGLTTRQIADSTHMMEQMVIDLENEQFGRIPAPIYGRGFVKLYCEAVGLDPKPLQAEFMEIFSGNRPATIRRREETAQPRPTPVPEEPKAPLAESDPGADISLRAAPAAETPSVPTPVLDSMMADAIDPEDENDGIIPAAEEPAPVTAAEPPLQEEDSLFAFAQQPLPDPDRTPQQPAPDESDTRDDGLSRLVRGPSRYAAPAPIDDESSGHGFALPTAVWRILAIVATAAVLLWLACAGLRALYSALAKPAADTPPAASQEAAAPDATKPQAENSRTPMDIPPLYID